MHLARAVLAVIAVAVSPAALAAPCAGFVDVEDTSQFCANVHWLRNRQITLGCTSTTQYCPNDAVSRLAMAAFLNRLGNALEPFFLREWSGLIAPIVNMQGVVCALPPYLIEDYPRWAQVSGVVYHRAATAQTLSTRLVYSLDNGLTWQGVSSGYVGFATNPPAGYATQATATEGRTLSPGDFVRFGIQVNGVGGLPSVDDAGCHLKIRFDSHTGLGPPF